MSPLLVDMDALTGMLSLSAKTIERMMEAGTFPAPLERCGKRLWKYKAIEAWVEQMDNASKGEGIREKTIRILSAVR